VILSSTLLVLFAGARWIVPAAFSYYEAHQALAITRVVPTELSDSSVSQAPGKTLSFFGYDFEIPWPDLDESQTKLYPTDKPKCRADLRFRSGLRMIVTAVRARELVDALAEQAKIRAAYGKSDYDIVRTIYEFSPDKMQHWNARVLFREQFLLILKTAAVPTSAQSGIFDIRNNDFRGFQAGNPQVRQDGIVVHLFADDGSVEFIFSQKDYKAPSGITQPEINRIIQSLHGAPRSASTTDAQIPR
jgi:hypothetical protein